MNDVQGYERSRVGVPHGPMGGFARRVRVYVVRPWARDGRVPEMNERETLVSTHISAVNFQLLW